MKRFLYYLLCCALTALGISSLWVLLQLQGAAFFSMASLEAILNVFPYALAGSLLILGLITFGKRKGGSSTSIEAEARAQAEDLLPAPVTPRDGFGDIAGYQPVKDYLHQIAEKLTDPQQRKSLPRGILLYGPPGTGKTLFARAMAGEVNCPFFSVAASEFTNRLVGQGARNVRALYTAARKHPVSVVFIDEIDAIGQARRSDGNQEERMTLNQLLAELDGFNKDGPFVLTIAATNDFDGLDRALTRAGRFDRCLSIPAPNWDDRKSILLSHAAGAAFSRRVNFDDLATITDTFSGAKLASLVREAKTAAEGRSSNVVEPCDIDLALVRVMTSGEPVRLTDPTERRATAYHEAGHALAAKLLLGEDVPRVSIMGSTSGISGWTLHVWPRNRGVHQDSREDLENQIILLYAGRVAELMGGGTPNVGSKSDIQSASEQIRAMIQHYGFVGAPLDTTLFDGASEQTVETAKELAKELYARAESFLGANRGKLDAVAAALLEQETMDNAALEQVLQAA